MNMNYAQISAYAIKQVSKAISLEGGFKREESWTTLMNELEMYYNEFKSGRDLTDDGTYLLSHVAHRALLMLDQYRTNPNLDDRYKPYMNHKKIVLDVDDVVADFTSAFTQKYNIKEGKYWDSTYSIKQKLNELKEDKSFFINLPVKHYPNFIPYAYVSARSIPVEWTMEFLEKNNLPCSPVFHVPFNASKTDTLLDIGAEIFVDDKFTNFVEAQKAGITSFLMDASHNQHYDVGYRRIYNLDIMNIIR